MYTYEAFSEIFNSHLNSRRSDGENVLQTHGQKQFGSDLL